jgi:hypothetical protein
MKSIKRTITFLFMCLLVASVGFSSTAEVKEKLALEMEMLKANPNAKDKATLGAIRVAKENQPVMNLVKVHPDQEKIDYYERYGYPESNNTFSSTRDCEAGDPEYTFSCGGGSWGSEVSWTLSDGSSGIAEDGTICLADGDYSLTMVDAYGDGWNGNTWTLTDANGNVVASCGLDSGSEGSCDFTLGGAPPVAGCTDPNAPNYNPEAVVDDGSCELYCSDTQWMCASGDQCVPASFVCDGSSEWGNAGWGPDCADGSDEVLEECCAAGASSYDGYCGGGDDDGGDDGGIDPNEGLCFDDADYNYDVDGDGYVDDASLCGYYVQFYGYSCEEVESYGMDCTAVADCDGCPVTTECDDAGGNSAWQGDGYCDSSNNIEACGYDNGDCCACDCVDGSFYDCDTYGGGACDDPSGNDGDVECWDGSMVCAAEDCSEQPGGCDKV